MSRDVTYASTDSPVGTLWVAMADSGIVRVSTGIEGSSFARQLLLQGDYPAHAPCDLADVMAQFDEYFIGDRRRFDVQIDLLRVTPFQRQVLQAVTMVPYGELRSYRDIAEAIGRPNAARAVGSAVALSPISIVIPCHRVIRSEEIRRQHCQATGPGADERQELIRLEQRQRRLTASKRFNQTGSTL